MQVTLYQTTSPNYWLIKSLSGAKTLDCQFTDGASVLNPVLKLLRDDSLAEYNYLYIPKFNRYYFISNITFDGEFAIITAFVDVLMSHQQLINESYVIAERSSSDYEKLIADPMVQPTSEKIVGIYRFPVDHFQMTESGYHFLVNILS